MLVYWIQVVHLAIGLASLQTCDSSGMLSIQLIEYNNKQHQVKNGDCCDTPTWCSLDSCDNYFEICVTKKSQSDCNLGKIKTKVLGNDKLTFPGIGGDLGGGHTNPLLFNFQTWKGFTLSVDIWDHDTGAIRGNHDFVDSIDLDIEDSPGPDSQSAVTNRKRMKSTTSPSNRYLDLDIKVYCTNNSLVPDCSRQCTPRDDDRGHYTCDYVIGRIICNKNWYGDRCTKYCRPRNDTQENYMCDSFGEKNCSEHWFGGNCSKYCKNRDDRNGHYQCEAKTGRKVCLANWYGDDCLVFCIARDDTGGHYSCNSTNGERVCLADWFGGNCTKHCLPQDDLSLGHYTCDVSGNKVCLPGWQGDNCTKAITAMITCHSKLELWIDGVWYGRDNGEWAKPSNFEISKNVAVIAIQGVDFGNQGGILGSLSSGLVTDESWKCTKRFHSNWMGVRFDDSVWPRAVTYGYNGANPWGRVPGIADNANWIWSDDNKNDQVVYCRRTLKQIPPTEVIKSMETLHTRHHTEFYHSNTVNHQAMSSRLEAGISTVSYSKFNTYTLSSTILSVWKSNNHEPFLNSSANHFSAFSDFATIQETSSAIPSASHSTMFLQSSRTQAFNTKKHTSNPSSFRKTTSMTLVSDDKSIQAIRTSSADMPSSIFVTKSYKSETNKAASLTTTASIERTTEIIKGSTTVEKYSHYSSQQEGKSSFVLNVLSTSNVELGNSNSIPSNIRTTRIYDTRSLGNSEEITHGIDRGKVFSTISQPLLPSTTSFNRFQTSKVSNTTLGLSARTHSNSGQFTHGIFPGKIISTISPSLSVSSTLSSKCCETSKVSNNTPGLSLRPSDRITVASSLSDGAALYTGLPKTSQTPTVRTGSTTVSPQPDELVPKKLESGTTLIKISERVTGSQITPSTPVVRSTVISLYTEIAETEEFKQTLKFVLYLQTEWRQDNEKQLESSLRQQLKTMYSNTPNENDFRLRGVNVSTAKECQNVVLLNVDISFMKANRFQATLPPFIQRDVQLLIKNEFKASEAVSRNATQEFSNHCNDKPKKDQTNKTYLVLAVILFTFLLLAVGVGVCITKIKNRKRKVRKVYPECWALATKHEDITAHVPSTLGSRSSQVPLHLEEL